MPVWQEKQLLEVENKKGGDMSLLQNDYRQELLQTKDIVEHRIRILQDWLNDDPEMPTVLIQGAVALIERGETKIREINLKLGVL